MAKERYIYPAIFSYDADGISVEFPDLPGCVTTGDSDREALAMAREATALHLYGLEHEDVEIPKPSAIQQIVTGSNQAIVLVEAWMPPFRDEMAWRSVKKTLTIPKWLDDMARESRVNYSHILQDALKEYLGVKDKKRG